MQSKHTRHKFVSVDQNTVILRFVTPPGSDSMDALMTHATCPMQIIRLMEYSKSRQIYVDFVQYVDEWRRVSI